MIIEELAYKVTVRAEEFLSGKKKVEQGAKDLGDNVTESFGEVGKATKEAGKGVKAVGDQTKKTADDTKRPFGLISGGFLGSAKAAKEFGKQGKSAFSDMQLGAAKYLGLALSIEGTRRLFTSAVNNAVDLKNVSSFLDMDPKAVDGWKKGAESVGSSAEAITSALLKMKNANAQMHNGQGQQDASTQALLRLAEQTQVDIFGTQDAGEMYKRMEEAYRKLSKDDQAFYIGAIGIDASLDPSMRDKSLDKRQTQFQNSSPYSEKMAEDAVKVKIKMVELDQSIDGVGNSLVLAFGPAVTTAMDEFSHWIDKNKGDVIGFFKDGAKWAGEFKDAVGGTSNALSTLGVLYAVKKGFGAKGLLGKAGWAGAAAYMSEPVIDYGLNKSLGKSDYFQAIRTAGTWSDFGKAIFGNGGGAGWVGGKWIDPRGKESAKDEPEQHAQSTRKVSNQFGMDALMNAVMMTESRGNPNAVSPAGAVGAYQFMPDTARDMGLRVDESVDERRDPAKSRAAATKYMNQLLNRYGGNIELALMAYNGGMGRVDDALKGKGKPLAQETLEYPGKVADYYQQVSQLAGMQGVAGMQTQTVDNSQSSATHINNVNITSNPQSIDEIAKSIDEQRRRSSMTGAFISGNG